MTTITIHGGRSATRARARKWMNRQWMNREGFWEAENRRWEAETKQWDLEAEVDAMLNATMGVEGLAEFRSKPNRIEAYRAAGGNVVRLTCSPASRSRVY